MEENTSLVTGGVVSDLGRLVSMLPGLIECFRGMSKNKQTKNYLWYIYIVNLYFINCTRFIFLKLYLMVVI